MSPSGARSTRTRPRHSLISSALRHEKGISQEALADLAGLHRTYVGGIERGERNPSLINIGRIAEALGVPILDLFDFEDERKK